MVYHLEEGRCSGAPEMNSDAIYHLIRSMDTDNVISKNSAAWFLSSPMTITAGEDARRGNEYKCYACPRKFKTLNSLNQHLNSSNVRELNLFVPPRCRKPARAAN